MVHVNTCKLTTYLNPQHITLNLCQTSTLQFWLASGICWVQMLPSTVDLSLFRLWCHETRIEWQWFNLKSPSWLHHSLHQWLCLRKIALPHSNPISYWSQKQPLFLAASFFPKKQPSIGLFFGRPWRIQISSTMDTLLKQTFRVGPHAFLSPCSWLSIRQASVLDGHVHVVLIPKVSLLLKFLTPTLGGIDTLVFSVIQYPKNCLILYKCMSKKHALDGSTVLSGTNSIYFLCFVKYQTRN